MIVLIALGQFDAFCLQYIHTHFLYKVRGRTFPMRRWNIPDLLSFFLGAAVHSMLICIMLQEGKLAQVSAAGTVLSVRDNKKKTNLR